MFYKSNKYFDYSMFVYFCYATHSVTKNVYDVYDFVNGAEF